MRDQTTGGSGLLKDIGVSARVPYASFLLPGRWALIPGHRLRSSVTFSVPCRGDPPLHLFPVARPGPPRLTPARPKNMLPPGGGDGPSSSRGDFAAPPCHVLPEPTGCPLLLSGNRCAALDLARRASLRFGTRNRRVLSASPAPLKVKPRRLAIPCPVSNPTPEHHGFARVSLSHLTA